MADREPADWFPSLSDEQLRSMHTPSEEAKRAMSSLGMPLTADEWAMIKNYPATYEEFCAEYPHLFGRTLTPEEVKVLQSGVPVAPGYRSEHTD